MLGQYSAGPEWVVILISGIFSLGLYFLPTIIAIVRKMPNTGSVFVVNLLLGWTFIGWIVALVMAAGSAQPRAALQATSTASTAPLPPPPGTATAAPTFVHIGQRYRFGYSIDPPSYGIWDGENPGPPIERFPYNDHGKTEGLDRFRALEPESLTQA